ncbi:MAG: Holliday junction branch migration protein RuvA [Alphaproteobacteria bacterium]|nr:Holliday junction branch migration protein RuvA [Alphaproteobacteria bacterium]
MIAKLRGIVDSFGEDCVVIDVNGVGYLVYASSRTLSKLVKGSETTLFTETVVREDSISLYGFGTALEKEWFLTLTKVQGVGAKVCLSILSALTPSQLAQAIAAQDKASFTRANGVGPKLAARIVTELKGKMVGLPIGADTTDYVAAVDDSPMAIYVAEEKTNRQTEDAVSALVNLGYPRVEAYRAVNLALAKNPEADFSSLIKSALKEFGSKEM